MIKIASKIIFAWALFMSLALYHPYRVSAEVNVDIHIVPPPLFTVSAPPEVVVIPDSYVYFIPDIEVDILFYQGYWYRPHGGYWYRAASYNGPWVYIVRKNMPAVILNLSPGFRHISPGHTRIPFKHLKENWKSWEKKRYWDKDRGHKGKGKRR